MKAFITLIFLLSATVDANENEKAIEELRKELNKIFEEANQTIVSKRYFFDIKNFKSNLLF